jgi:RNA polymerase sigma-70 factor (ECF subfamily)
MPRADRELMAAFQEGDEGAFAELFERHGKPLLNFFYRMCYDRAASEDLVQETFLRVIRSRETWRPDASFTTWLYTVARNLWIDRHRSRKAAPKTVSADLPASDGGGSLVDRVETREEGPVKQVADREAAALVRRAIEDLPEAQRMVFLLAEAQGLKYREIARILEVPIGTVKSRMNAAVARLRGLLGHVLR